MIFFAFYYIQTPKWDPDHPPEKLFGGKIGLGMRWNTLFGHLKGPLALFLRYKQLRRLIIQLAAGCAHWLSGARRTPKQGNWPGNAVAFNWSSSGAIALVLTPESRSAYLNFGVQFVFGTQILLPVSALGRLFNRLDSLHVFNRSAFGEAL